MNAALSADALGLDAARLEQAGGAWTAREILQQPSLWGEVAALVTREAPRLGAFLDSRRTARLVLTGAGTSAFIGECLVPALVRAGRDARAIATTDLIADPAGCLAGDAPLLLVSFARSGNSPESVAALEVAQALTPEVAHLIFTCNPDGALYRLGQTLPAVCTVLMPEASHDRGFAMTSSFTGMLLAAGLCLGALPRDAARTARLARAARQVLPGVATRVHDLVREGFERVVYLGSGALKGLAREAALKMLELTDGRVVALGESPLGFRHGPKTILNARTLVVLFVSPDAHARRYDLDLVAELRRERIAGRVVALAGQRADSPHEDDIVLSDCAALTELELCLPYAVLAQALALLRSISLGVAPDTPNAAGAVNRVVQGVTLYPWNP
ncbi:MAG: SIS domain-containing protein [Gammaproteobacteria bacterium]|nr:SIS domain-containing protein [Gammaproteobacteria bacterium]MBV9620618.1 SIS domain-containing protein [Gammaproteobacteria bacterium]